MIPDREALHHALREEMTRDERVLIFGEDVVAYGGAYGVTSGLAKDFGEKRVFDAPIAEGGGRGSGNGGAAASGRTHDDQFCPPRGGSDHQPCRQGHAHVWGPDVGAPRDSSGRGG